MFTHRIDDDLELRLLEESDAESLFDILHRNWDRFEPWFGADFLPETLSVMQERVSTSISRAKSKKSYEVLILMNEEIVGRIFIYAIDNKNHVAELAYWIDGDATGRGIVHRSCCKVISDAFEVLKLNRIQIRTHPDHKRSITVAKKLGFQHEGRIRQDYFRNGEHEDSELFSLLASEWRERSGE